MPSSDKHLAALVAVFESGRKFKYDKGEFIIRLGEDPSHVFYIEEGLVKAFNISKYGEENLLIIRKSQEVFPLIWAITGSEREITYQALTPTTVWRIPREKYQEFINSHPTAMRPILEMVTEMYRLHSERLLNLQYRSVRERLISFLLTMAERFGVETDEGVLIDAPLRHQDIGSSINASRETASRQMAVLENKGLVDHKRSYITIKDKPALEALL